jgi:alpha-tubulin suppressor-like RCC1 family protein
MSGSNGCGVLTSGTIDCWGSGNAGQLGNGALPSPSGPVAVQGISDAVRVSTFLSHSCAVRAGGQVACWG